MRKNTCQKKGTDYCPAKMHKNTRHKIMGQIIVRIDSLELLGKQMYFQGYYITLLVEIIYLLFGKK